MVEQATADRQVSGSIPEGSFFVFDSIQSIGEPCFSSFGIIFGSLYTFQHATDQSSRFIPMKNLAAILIIDSCLAVYRVPDPIGTGMNLFGVNPEKEYMYKVDGLVCPGNPSKKLTPEMINDDFCDCPEDGFDEPGTSACNNGVFYCANKEFFPKEISSTLVNDGVCGTHCEGRTSLIPG